MKKKPDLLDTIQGRTIDESAYTFDEIIQAKNISFHHALELIRLNLSTGAWEQVHKRSSSGRLVKAYRLKR